MPNHVHVVVTPAPDHDLTKILHSRKTFSAKVVVGAGRRSGQVWQHESFDHVVRSRVHLAKYEGSIRENPVKAGLRKGFVLGAGTGAGMVDDVCRAGDGPASKLKACATAGARAEVGVAGGG